MRNAHSAGFRRRPGYPAAISVLSLCLLLLPSCYTRPGISWRPGPDGKQPKARTVAELSDRYDSRHCGECHEEIYGQWKNSIHSRSLLGSGRTAGALAAAVSNGLMEWSHSGVAESTDVRVEHLMSCAKCHLPQLSEASDDVAREVAAAILRLSDAKGDEDAKTVKELEGKLSALNIGCLVCHNRSAVIHKWADGYPRAKTVYGIKGKEHLCGLYPKGAVSPVLRESIFCGQCHGQGPNFEFDNPTQCSTAYSSYLFSYRAKGGKEECQDCHMRKQKQGHDMRSYTDPRMVKEAVDFRFGTAVAGNRDGRGEPPRILASVTMVNRAGHGIPDG